MSKIFKTISLEERLKNSSYNNIGQTPGDVNQGSTTIKKIESNRQGIAEQIKILGTNVEQGSIVLKNTIGGLNTREVLQIKNPRIQFLQDFTLPKTNTDFRTSISLADRLKQSNLGTTNHLPQFFLSDIFTNYIQITPFGVFSHFSPIGNPVFNYIPTQGGVIPTPITFTPFQGGVIPTTFIFDSLIAQGTYLSNNTYFSFTTIQLPGSILQGETTVGPITFVPIQGETTVGPITYIPVQGQTTVGPYLTIVNQGPGVVPTLPINITQQVPTSIIITPSAFIPVQGGVNPTAFVFQPSIESPTLDILRYEADRLLAIFTPRLKHGSTITIVQSQTPEEIAPLQGTIELKQTPSNPIDSTEQLATKIEAEVNFAPSSTTTNLNNYKTLSYGQIAQRARQSGVNREDFRKSIGLTTYTDFASKGYPATPFHERLGIPRYGDETAKGQVHSPNSFFEDLIKVRIYSARDERAVQFRAYLTALSDGFTQNWTDIKYVGRQDTFKYFTGVTRQFNLAFKVPALTAAETDINIDKLNTLVNIASIGTVTTKNFVTAPLCYIKVGMYLDRVYCTFNSVKFELNPSEYSWDIGKELPQVIDVSLDGNLILSNNGNLFNSDQQWFR